MKKLVLALALVLPASVGAQDLTIVNIRVGQGDATLVQGPVDAAGKRVNVLFDAGDIDDRDGGHILRAVLWKRGVRELDFLVISHDDADHMGGAVDYGTASAENGYRKALRVCLPRA